MTLATHLARLLAYDDWANRETLTAMKAADSPPARALRLLAHIVGAERLWLGRLEGEPPTTPVWPEWTLAECELGLAELPGRWRDVLGDLGAANLARRVAYTNTKGEPWENTVLDILTHVVVHGAYHRGQIAADLRAAGREPAYTDFIHSARKRYIE